MLFRDLRYALRTINANRGFTAAVVLSLALGIAANTTAFTIVNAALFGSLPVRDPGGLYVIGGAHGTTSYPAYRDFGELRGRVFTDLAAHFPLAPANLAGTAEPERVWGQLVTGNYFQLVGVPMALGRGIAPHEDEVQGRNPVVVLSDALWRRRFNASPTVVGETVVFNGHRYTVIGVTAPAFRGSDRAIVSEFWAPLAMGRDFVPELAKDLESRTMHWLEISVRLAPGVSPEQAQAAVAVVHKRIHDAHHKKDELRAVTLLQAGGVPSEGRAGVNGFMIFLMCVVGLVLLIACANAANLLLAKAVERRHEMAIRLAVGAGRARLLRQLLVESVTLSSLGALCGLGLAYFAGLGLARFQLPIALPVALDLTPDHRVLAFTAGVALFAGVLFGIAPALSATRKGLAAAIASGGARFAPARRLGLGKLLVAVQVTLSVVLLTGSGLFLRSLQEAAALDLGIRSDNVLMLAVDPKTNQYTDARTREFLRQIETRLTALPNVTSVAAVNLMPLSLAQNEDAFREVGGQAGKSTSANVFHVTAGYFETLKLPLLRGRNFNAQRDTEQHAILINQALARDLFGNQDPLGRRLVRGNKREPGFEVIGVVADSKSVTFGEAVRPAVYAYLPEKPDEIISLFGMTILVRTQRDPSAAIGAVRAEIQSLDPTLAIFNIDTVDNHVAKAFFFPRVCAALFGTFGGIGLLLASVGLFGLISYSVRTRTREIGVRIALGAAPSAVVRLVLRQGLTLVIPALAIGLALAFALSRLAASLLYGVSAADPVTFLLVPTVLLAVALTAILIPARRAMRISPSSALHTD